MSASNPECSNRSPLLRTDDAAAKLRISPAQFRRIVSVRGIGADDTFRWSHGRSGSGIGYLWSDETLARIRETAEYVRASSKAGAARRAQARATAQRRKDALVATIAAWDPKLPDLSEAELQRRAIASYNGGTDRHRATEDSDRDFLDRITVNFARHELTHYDGLLNSFHGKVGIQEAKEMVRSRVYDAIASKWPHLRRECSQQECDRLVREEAS